MTDVNLRFLKEQARFADIEDSDLLPPAQAAESQQAYDDYASGSNAAGDVGPRGDGLHRIRHHAPPARRRSPFLAMFVRIAAGAVAGIDAVVTVEVNIAAAGQLGMFLVGLPDNAVKESEQRIRAAFENSGERMTGKKVVVSLAPADLRKGGGGFRPADRRGHRGHGQVRRRAVAGTMLAGELSLDGTLKPVRGIPMAVKAREEGLRRLVLPCENAARGRRGRRREVIGAARWARRSDT